MELEKFNIKNVKRAVEDQYIDAIMIVNRVNHSLTFYCCNEHREELRQIISDLSPAGTMTTFISVDVIHKGFVVAEINDN